MSHERALYLDKYWSRYPAVPGQNWHRGRLGLDIEIKAIAALALDSSDFTATQVLVAGDLIAYNSEKVVLLAPCLNPAGLQKLTENKKKEFEAERWSHFLQQTRSFFLNQGFYEAQSPTLTVCPGTEPFLDVFETELRIGTKKEKKYLPTSPELSLKKLLVQGQKNIFEMRPCFRNNEATNHHLPEFWMLEWYRAYENLGTIVEDLKKLVIFLCDQFSLPKPTDFGTQSVAELFQKYCRFTLTPTTSYSDLENLCASLQISSCKDDLWDDLFYRVFVDKIETQLQTLNPLFVHSYPPSQAAYSRISRDGWGERFEMYWKGLEICNAFHELTDPVIQKQRFLEDFAKKEKTGRTTFPMDEEFLQALELGMPPSAGIALGLERLYMALFNVKDIHQFKLFET
ncbi:MAG: EF-P lysine aminoacylase EpmA [Pseudobdellovibrionaceae bacterium]